MYFVLEPKEHEDTSLKAVVYACVCFKGAWGCYRLTENSTKKSIQMVNTNAWQRSKNLVVKNDYSLLNCI